MLTLQATADVERKEESIAMGKSPSNHKATAKKRLLIVEDDDLMRTFYKSLFQRYEDEYICRYEKNGKDALAYLTTNRIDAVITDWDMPSMSGISLVKVIRNDSALSKVLIVMISGRISPEDRMLALKSGADEYFSKPLVVEIFLARLRDLLRR